MSVNLHTLGFCAIPPRRAADVSGNTHKSGDLTSQFVLTLAVPWLVSALIPTPGTKASDVFGNEKVLIFML